MPPSSASTPSASCSSRSPSDRLAPFRRHTGRMDEVTEPGFGVYLHVPFCAARCDYCSFATWTDRHHLTDAYLAACRTHLDRLVADGMPPATSVFVGGGTPSMVPAADLVAVLARIPLAPGAEVT